MDRYGRVIICLLQSVLLMSPLPVLALSSDLSIKLDTYEKALLGKSQPTLSTEARLSAVEKKLFGSPRSGSAEQRLAAISRVIGPKRTAHLMAMAPQMDTSQVRNDLPPVSPEPDTAPDFVHHNADHQRNSSLDSNENPVTDIIQQAIDAHNQNNVPLAERLFKEALARDPQNTDALYNLGAIAEGKGNLDGALMNYQAAARVSPQDTDIKQAITAVQTQIQDKRAAQAKAAQQAQVATQQQQQQGQLKKLASEAAQAYKSGNYDLAISNLEQVAQQAPNDPDVRFGLAQAYRGKGDFNRARDNLNRALAADPGNPQYQQALAQVDQQAQSHRNGGHGSRGPSTASGFPPMAPDFHNGGGGGFGDGGGSGAGGYGQDNNGPIASANDAASGPTGEITPFTPDAAESGGPHYGYANDGGYGGGGGGYSQIPGGGGYGGMSGSSRLQRAALGALGGAAMGGMMGRMSGGSFKGGAIMGGLMGLFMGFR